MNAPTPNPSLTASVDQVMRERRSVRAFLPTPVPRDVMEAILRSASRAPSGTNAQPWKVTVLTGAARQELSRRILAAYNDPEQAKQHSEEYDYYPKEWIEPYLSRRRKVGWDLYGLLGIGKTDRERMHAQHGRNYVFFDAPVGIILTIDRIMGKGSWFDFGMFAQNLMLAARARGLDTCPQAAFNIYHRIIADYLQLPPEQMVVCGMSLGYADPNKVENQLVTERAALDEFVRFVE